MAQITPQQNRESIDMLQEEIERLKFTKTFSKKDPLKPIRPFRDVPFNPRRKIDQLTLGNIQGITKVRVKATGNTTVPTTTLTKLSLQTEDYDVLKEFGSSRFTAKKTGYYLVCGAVYYPDITADKLYKALIYKNGTSGTEYGHTVVHSSNTGTMIIPVSDIIDLDKDDYLELYSYHNAGINRTVGTNLTFIAIHQVS